MASLIDKLESVGDLPALPHAASRVIAAMAGDGFDAGELTDIISLDEALSLAVVRRANSAAFGVPGREFNLKQSLVRLGEVELRRLVLNAQAGPMLIGAGRAFGLRRGALWRGAVGGAFAAEIIAKNETKEDPGYCYLAALFRDIGKLALDAHFGEEYSSRVAFRIGSQQTFAEAERAELGFDHCELGAELALRWGMPDRVSDAIRYHHDPPTGADQDDLIDVVHGADVLCLWAGLGVGDDGLHYRVADHVRERITTLKSRANAEATLIEVWSRVSEVEFDLGLRDDEEERRTA